VISAAVEQDDVVLVQVSLAVPKIRSCIGVFCGVPCDLIAGVGVRRLIVQADRARATWQSEFGCIDAYPAKEALQPFGNATVTIGTSMARRDGDLGDVGVLPVLIPVMNVPWQTQQGHGLGLANRIVPTLVGDHRFGDGDLAPPFAQLHDQRKIHAPRHVVEDKVPIGIGQRRSNGLARYLTITSGAGHPCGDRVQRRIRDGHNHVV
jgi:hypothetical protein